MNKLFKKKSVCAHFLLKLRPSFFVYHIVKLVVYKHTYFQPKCRHLNMFIVYAYSPPIDNN